VDPAVAILRRSLHLEVVERLRDFVVDGRLKPGEKINEAALCAAFGVSRTPLREAVKALAAEGLVCLTPNRGASVATITADEIGELFPIMGALEALAGGLACLRVSDAQLTTLRGHHDRILRAHAKGDWVGYIKANRAFHDGIFAAAGNSALTALYGQLLARTHAIRFVTKPSAQRWQEAVDDHEKIMAALAARRAKTLGKYLRRHVEHKAATALEGLKSSD